MKLVPINQVNPSSYNPRKADPRRLDILELSLRKIGWVMPIYADKSGEILSGHQRHHVAQRMGMKYIPVEYVKDMSLAERKSTNIVFNRGTNDLNSGDVPADMTEALEKHNPFALAEKMPDATEEKMYRCVDPVEVLTKDLIKANAGKWKNYAKNVSRTLHSKGVKMAIVCTPDNVVVNGIGRLQLYSELRYRKVPVVYISDKEAEFTYVMLNYLSMDFDIHTRYADVLRYNSFRRPVGKRDYLGRAFTFAILRNKPSKTFDIKKPSSLAMWKSIYGNNVVDFGAGLLDETKILRSVGINSVCFEPFLLEGNSKITREGAKALTGIFLEEVAKGYRFDSIFLSAILNSVPFLQDRLHIIYILNALATEDTKVYAVSSSVKQAGYQIVTGKEFANELDAKRIQFLLGYEPRVTLGDFSKTPKMQKYFTPQEWHDLFHERFAKVKVTQSSNNVEAVASQPRDITLARLDEALEFEFNLPYPDGKTMDMIDQAKAAFRERFKNLGTVLK